MPCGVYRRGSPSMRRTIIRPSGRPMEAASSSNPIERASTTCTGNYRAASEPMNLESDQLKAPTDWSSDGRFLLFRNQDPQTGFDLWVLPLSGDKKPFPFLKTPFEEREGQFSPDGNWIAYQSNESGRFEIYVQPFPAPGGKFQISANGGAQPRWNKNGKEIFYVSLDSKMMAAPVKSSPDRSLETGTPAVL